MHWWRKQEEHPEGGSSLLKLWNISAVATVALPLFIFFIARLVNRDGGGAGEENKEGSNWWWWGGNIQNNENGEEGGGQEEEEAAAEEEEEQEDEEGRRILWWWGSENNPEEEERGNGTLVFVYIWSLLVFAYLIWYGNRVLKKEKENPMQVLLASLFFFANLAFLCSMMSGGFVFQTNGAKAEEEEGWLERWPAVMFLTYVSWTIFAVVFAIIVYRKTRKGSKTSSSLNDYHRQDDEDGIF
jgi:hypothetical protein